MNLMTSPDRTLAPDFRPITKLDVQKAGQVKLTNGIPVYTINAGFQDLVRIEWLFRLRSFDPQRPLLQNAANRLLQEGTSKKSAQEIADQIDYFGAFLETEEGPDTVSIVLYTLNKHLPKMLPIVRELFADAVYPEHELGIYKQNQVQRLTVENEKVQTLARRRFLQLLFGQAHPYGFYVSAEHYLQLDREELEAYRRRHYTNDNCTIFVAGKLPADLEKLLDQHFGDSDWKTSESMSESRGVTMLDPTQKHYQEKPGAIQSAIRIGKPLFRRSDPEYPAMSVLNTVLGGYFGSRLMSNIREDKGYTYGIGSALVSMKEAGYFFISTEVGADVTEAALKEIYFEIDRLCNDPVPESELAMVRNFLLGNFLKGIDGPFALLDRSKTLVVNGLDYDYYTHYIKVLQSVTPAELLELARRVWKPDSFTELVVGKR
ncbi:MAG: insulinase family protein [Bacteroidia bacterium]|nr:insulinase family protein [Bacteroidia bacterium]